MPGSPMMQPVTLLGCKESVNDVTEPGSVVPVAGAAVLMPVFVGWLQPAISIAVAGTAAMSAVKNIVLVHGAITDGSGWRGVYDILTKDGYHVSVVQQPLTGLADDVTATKRVLDQQDGPVILVGHSYGGTVITVAGADPKVRALVYVAALQPDKGETTNQLTASMPGEMSARGA